MNYWLCLAAGGGLRPVLTVSSWLSSRWESRAPISRRAGDHVCHRPVASEIAMQEVQGPRPRIRPMWSATIRASPHGPPRATSGHWPHLLISAPARRGSARCLPVACDPVVARASNPECSARLAWWSRTVSVRPAATGNRDALRSAGLGTQRTVHMAFHWLVSFGGA